MENLTHIKLQKNREQYRDQFRNIADTIIAERIQKDNIEWDSLLNQFIYHFEQTLHLQDPGLITEYMKWASTYLENRSLSADIVEEFLVEAKKIYSQTMGDVIKQVLDKKDITDSTIQSDFTDAHSSFIHEGNPFFDVAKEYLQFLLNGDRHSARKLILDAVEQGTDIKDIYMHVFQPCQYEVGRLWQLNQVNIAQEHFCTAATQMIMSMLYEHIFSTERINRSIVATTIGGDLHEIGIRMVADFFEIHGWDTYYLGANIPNQELIDALLENDADMLALSVTLMSFLSQAQTLIDEIRTVPELDNVKILTGGQPFILESGLWKKVGADGFAINAQKAVETAHTLIPE